METTSPEVTDTQPAPPQRRLAGSFSVAEQEEADRRRRRAARARAKRFRSVRLVAGTGLLVAAVCGVITWRDLSRKLFEASEPLKYIGIQYELQRMEILRYAPFHSRRDRKAMRELDQAMGDISSEDLRERVQAIGEVRSILRPRVSGALRKLGREFPHMKETFEISLEDSDLTIAEHVKRYRETAKAYNSAASSPAGWVVRSIVGFPEKLAPLKD